MLQCRTLSQKIVTLIELIAIAIGIGIAIVDRLLIKKDREAIPDPDPDSDTDSNASRRAHKGLIGRQPESDKMIHFRQEGVRCG